MTDTDSDLSALIARCLQWSWTVEFDAARDGDYLAILTDPEVLFNGIGDTPLAALKAAIEAAAQAGHEIGGGE